MYLNKCCNIQYFRIFLVLYKLCFLIAENKCSDVCKVFGELKVSVDLMQPLLVQAHHQSVAFSLSQQSHCSFESDTSAASRHSRLLPSKSTLFCWCHLSVPLGNCSSATVLLNTSRVKGQIIIVSDDLRCLCRADYDSLGLNVKGALFLLQRRKQC